MYIAILTFSQFCFFSLAIGSLSHKSDFFLASLIFFPRNWLFSPRNCFFSIAIASFSHNSGVLAIAYLSLRIIFPRNSDFFLNWFANFSVFTFHTIHNFFYRYSDFFMILTDLIRKFISQFWQLFTQFGQDTSQVFSLNIMDLSFSFYSQKLVDYMSKRFLLMPFLNMHSNLLANSVITGRRRAFAKIHFAVTEYNLPSYETGAQDVWLRWCDGLGSGKPKDPANDTHY